MRVATTERSLAIASRSACPKGSIVGIICGHISLSQIKKTGEEGRGLAVAGLIVGYIGLALAILSVIIIAIVFGAIAANGGFDQYQY